MALSLITSGSLDLEVEGDAGHGVLVALVLGGCGWDVDCGALRRGGTYTVVRTVGGGTYTVVLRVGGGGGRVVRTTVTGGR